MLIAVCIPEDNDSDDSFFTRVFKDENDLSDWIEKTQEEFPHMAPERVFGVDTCFVSVFNIVEGDPYPQPFDYGQLIRRSV